MKRSTSALILSLAVATGGCSGAADVGEPESLEQKASYVLGFSAGQQLSSQGAEVDVDQLVSGLRDAFAGVDSPMSDEEMQATMMEYQQVAAAEAEARGMAEGAANKEAGDAFLADNATKSGVIVTESGLQYEVLVEGDGPSPNPTDQITAHYEGRLIDGTVFDSSIEKGTPMTIGLNQLVPGFSEGVGLMKVGSKHRLFIPGEIGYGARGAGRDIGPNATLIFEVELLAVNGQS